MEAKHYPPGLYEQVDDSYFYIGPPLPERKKSKWPMFFAILLVLGFNAADIYIFAVAK